jgi:hypothetical protein
MSEALMASITAVVLGAACGGGSGNSSAQFCRDQSPSALSTVEQVESGVFSGGQGAPSSDDLYNLGIASFATDKMAKEAPSEIKADVQLLSQTLTAAKANPAQSGGGGAEVQVLSARGRVQLYISSHCH